MFCRFFALVFGGFGQQDEAKISALLGLGTYTVAIVVLLVLLVMVLRASYVLSINLKKNGYILTMSVLCNLMVIGTYRMIS